jgi:hypothetical protein
MEGGSRSWKRIEVRRRGWIRMEISIRCWKRMEGGKKKLGWNESKMWKGLE